MFNKKLNKDTGIFAFITLARSLNSVKTESKGNLISSSVGINYVIILKKKSRTNQCQNIF